MTSVDNLNRSSIKKLLGNTTARAVFYSCISDDKTIPEIANIWDYKTTTFFYQTKQKKVLEDLEKTKLVSRRKIGSQDVYSSNYLATITDDNLSDFFDEINLELENERILEEFDYEVTEDQLKDKEYKEFCISKKPNLKEDIELIQFDNDEIRKFSALWTSDVTRKTLLSGDCLSQLVSREKLPEDPLEMLYGITIALCEEFYEIKEQTCVPGIYFPDFSVDISDLSEYLVPKIKELDKNEQEEFALLIKNIYEFIGKNFEEFYDEDEELGSFWSMKFYDLIFRRGWRRLTARSKRWVREE